MVNIAVDACFAKSCFCHFCKRHAVSTDWCAHVEIAGHTVKSKLENTEVYGNFTGFIILAVDAESISSEVTVGNKSCQLF